MGFAVFAVVALIHQANAVSSQMPFDPAFSFKQKEINFETLAQEIVQFQQIVAWHGLLGELAQKRMELEIFKSSFDRGEKLYSEGRISLSDFSRRRFLYRSTEARAAELEIRSEMFKEAAEIAKLAILQKGDSASDHRLEIVEKIRDYLTHQRQATDRAHGAAEMAEAYQAGRLAAAKQLLDDGNLPLDKYEAVALEHGRAAVDMESAARAGLVVDDALSGIGRAIDRLRSQGTSGRKAGGELKVATLKEK